MLRADRAAATNDCCASANPAPCLSRISLGQYHPITVVLLCAATSSWCCHATAHVAFPRPLYQRQSHVPVAGTTMLLLLAPSLLNQLDVVCWKPFPYAPTARPVETVSRNVGMAALMA